MIYARQSTAIIVTVGPVLDANGVAVTGGVVADYKISKNGGAPAALNGSATYTHRHTGYGSLSLTASDVDTVGTAEITMDDTVNACPIKEIQVLEPAVYDALFADTAPGYLQPTTAGRTLDVTATGAAGIDWGNVENPTTANNLSGTTTNLVNTATTLTNLPAITANWLTAAGIADDAFTAAKFATDAFTNDVLAASFVTEIQSGLATSASISALNNLSQAQAQTAAEAALVTHRLDELLNADSDIDGAAPPTVGSVFHELMSKTALSFTFDQTTDSLEALRDNTGTAGAGLTAIDLPDQTMNITGNITGNLSGSVGSVTGTVGSVTGAVGSVTGNVGGNVAGSVASVTAAVTLPTIPVDWITSSGLAASAVAEIQSGLSTLDAAGVRTAVGLAAADLDTQLAALPTAAENAAGLLDLTDGVESGVTPRQLLRGVGAAMFGLVTGAGTGTEVFKGAGQASGGTTRLTYTVDSSGNRSAVTLNL